MRTWILILPILMSLDVAADDGEEIAEIVVTSERREQIAQQHPGNIERIDSELIDIANAQHVSELLHRAPGVWIMRGSGQEHQTAIRSPILGGAGGCGAYLVLEDGIPIRPTNFCNGNQLMEVATEHAAAIEILRGPANALHGSNAMHGIVNVIMPLPGEEQRKGFGVEYGSNDFVRLRTEVSSVAEVSWLTSLVLARDNGFRDDSGYRQGKLHAGKRWLANGRDVSVMLSATTLSQDSAGFITGQDAYKDRDISRTNPNPEAWRDADSVRLRGSIAWTRDAVHYDVRPYLRWSRMEFMHHALPGKPVEQNGQVSFGAISSATIEFDEGDLILGADIELSDVFLEQHQAGPASGSPRVVETRPSGKHYDYNVRGLGAAIFVQGNLRFGAGHLLTGGARLEYAHYDYDNRMIDGNTRDDESPCGFGGCLYTRPADRSDNFMRLMPNLAASFFITDSLSAFAAVSRGYRFPQTLELYRLQNGQQVSDLSPAVMDNGEVGIHWRRKTASLDITLFHMRKRDGVFRDSLGFNVNGARSRHEGVELSGTWRLGDAWRLRGNVSYARHLYDFTTSGPGEDFETGNDIDTAPRWLGSVDIQFQPIEPLSLGLQFAGVGQYFIEPGNRFDYPGHVIANLRVAVSGRSGTSFALRVNNVSDERFADRADFARGDYRYLPGREREYFLEFRYSPLR